MKIKENKLYLSKDEDLKRIEENTIEFKDEENCQKMMRLLVELTEAEEIDENERDNE